MPLPVVKSPPCTCNTFDDSCNKLHRDGLQALQSFVNTAAVYTAPCKPSCPPLAAAPLNKRTRACVRMVREDAAACAPADEVKGGRHSKGSTLARYGNAPNPSTRRDKCHADCPRYITKRRLGLPRRHGTRTPAHLHTCTPWPYLGHKSFDDAVKDGAFVPHVASCCQRSFFFHTDCSLLERRSPAVAFFLLTLFASTQHPAKS